MSATRDKNISTSKILIKFFRLQSNNRVPNSRTRRLLERTLAGFLNANVGLRCTTVT